MIIDIMCNKFVNSCVSWDLDDNVDLDSYTEKSRSTAVHKNTNTSKDSNISLSNKVRVHENFEQLVYSLISVDKLHSALLLYKSRLSEAIRLIVRTCVLEYLSVFDPTVAVELMEDSSSGTDSDTPFAIRVKSMSNENFLSCLSMCFENLLLALQRCESVYNFISSAVEVKYSKSELNTTTTLDASKISSSSSNSNSNSSNSNSSSNNDLSSASKSEALEVTLSLNKSCKTSCCELAQRSLSQLISLRKEANSKLQADKMKYLWEISLQFITSM